MASASMNYEHVLTLGQGGMAAVEVVLRRDGTFHRLYARKRPHPELLRDPAIVEMFVHEARVAGLIRHPHVLAVVDAGTDEQGPFLIMEYVDGLPASALLARAVDSGRPLPLRVCLTIAAQAARGLAAAHALTSETGKPQPLVHRDVSPQNLLVGFDGLTRVGDFGVAKTVGTSGQTTVGLVKGNPGYVAPEALRFEELDARADLFGLGVVLYELLAGERLYPAREGDASARRILSEPPPDVHARRPETPPEVVELLFRLLAKDRDDRPASADEVAEILEATIRDAGLDDDPDLATFMAEEHGADRERLAAEIGANVRRVLEAKPRTRARWTRPTLAFVAIALAVAGLWAVRPSPLVPGMRGEYFGDTELRTLRATRVDPAISFYWDRYKPHEALPADRFSVRWTGRLVSPVTRNTRLCVISDDGVRLWLDGQLVISKWRQRPTGRDCVDVSLHAREPMALRLEYFEHEEEALVTLLWTDPQDAERLTPVPPSVLYQP